MSRGERIILLSLVALMALAYVAGLLAGSEERRQLEECCGWSDK